MARLVSGVMTGSVVLGAWPAGLWGRVTGMWVVGGRVARLVWACAGLLVWACDPALSVGAWPGSG